MWDVWHAGCVGHAMKRFVNASRKPKAAPRRIITATYRVVTRDERMQPGAAPEPLKPATSFSELAARAYGQSRTLGADRKVDSVA